MNKTAELVRLWAIYEETNPDADLKDFYSEQLLTGRKSEKNKFLAGLIPTENASVLTKLLGRLAKLQTAYAMMALKKKGIGSFEEFTFLTTMLTLDKPRKSEVISENFIELSSGLLVLDRLKAKGYVTETEDMEDKRSKRVYLTTRGKNTIKACHQLMDRMNKIFYQDLHESDIKLCIEMLKPLEIKFSSLWQKHRKKGFEEIYQSLIK
jgi:DNA-binding MarR family transcriptional regulator